MKVGSFLKARFEHARNQRKSRDQILDLQRKKFRRIVAHANEHSPYYRDLIKAKGIDISTCKPEDFPPLTKTIMMENFDRIVVDPRITLNGLDQFLIDSHDPTELFLGEFTALHTSGSSGTVGYFVYNQAEWGRAIALGMRTFPFSAKRRRVAFYGLTGGHYGGATTTSEGRGIARLRIDSRPFDVNAPIAQTVEKLNAFKPHILAGYPSAFRVLAEAKGEGNLTISPELLALGGEPLTPEDRAFFESAFGVPISNHYGTSEHSSVGYGLSSDGGIYLFEDEMIFEIDGDRTFVTNLFRTTQPLIRYQIDDRLEPIDDPNPRMPFMKIKDLQGRAKPNPIFMNQKGEDVFVSAHIFVEFFVRNVARIELRVFDKTSCVLRFRLRDGLSEADRAAATAGVNDRMREIFEEKDLQNVDWRTEEVKHFGGWKERLIILPDMVDQEPVLAEASEQARVNA